MIKQIPSFTSPNSLDSLVDGHYLLSETTYESSASALSATITTISAGPEDTELGADLIVVLDDGSVLFRDFLRLADGRWRDSNGLCDESLAGLLPAELARLRKAGPSKLTRVVLLNGAFSE